MLNESSKLGCSYCLVWLTSDSYDLGFNILYFCNQFLQVMLLPKIFSLCFCHKTANPVTQLFHFWCVSTCLIFVFYLVMTTDWKNCSLEKKIVSARQVLCQITKSDAQPDVWKFRNTFCFVSVKQISWALISPFVLFPHHHPLKNFHWDSICHQLWHKSSATRDSLHSECSAKHSSELLSSINTQHKHLVILGFSMGERTREEETCFVPVLFPGLKKKMNLNFLGNFKLVLRSPGKSIYGHRCSQGSCSTGSPFWQAGVSFPSSPSSLPYTSDPTDKSYNWCCSWTRCYVEHYPTTKVKVCISLLSYWWKKSVILLTATAVNSCCSKAAPHGLGWPCLL